MLTCVECGKEVFDLNYKEEDIRCYDCLYHSNLKKVTHKTTKYCLIIIGGFLVFNLLFQITIGFLWYFFF
jgi:DNA-directed RNA polymerase subunit RPC12/RpoP